MQGTIDPKGWKCTNSEGSVITLIDTPGFNDQKRPDTELLKSIVDYIRQQRFGITTVIYLHRITERKLTGSTILNLRVLRAVCGEHYLQNIVLATSMWATIPAQEMDDTVKREVQFNTSPAFWADMLEKGAKYFRWDETESIDGANTAGQIVMSCEKRRDTPKLSILLEMEKGSKLEDTTAHQILTEEMRKRLEWERRALMEEEEEMRRLQREKADLEATVGREQEDVRREIDALERVRGPLRSAFSTRSGSARAPGLISSLTSFSDGVAGAQVWDVRRDREDYGSERYRDVDVVDARDWGDRDEREREGDRGRNERYERDRDREREQERPDRRSGRRLSRPVYELVRVRRRW